MLGSPTEAKDFLFSLEYKGPKTTHAFLGEVASIDETLNAVVSEKSSSIAFQSFNKQFVERGIHRFQEILWKDYYQKALRRNTNKLKIQKINIALLKK